MKLSLCEAINNLSGMIKLSYLSDVSYQFFFFALICLVLCKASSHSVSEARIDDNGILNFSLTILNLWGMLKSITGIIFTRLCCKIISNLGWFWMGFAQNFYNTTSVFMLASLVNWWTFETIRQLCIIFVLRHNLLLINLFFFGEFFLLPTWVYNPLEFFSFLCPSLVDNIYQLIVLIWDSFCIFILSPFL